MLDFQLFRIRLLWSGQGYLFEGRRIPCELLRRALEERPEAAGRLGVVWHVGNLESLDDSGIYFRFGKTTRATIEAYRDGRFGDEEFEVSPYTHVFCDLGMEVAAIAKKTSLAPHTAGIATQLARWLKARPALREQEVEIEIGEIKDPKDFLTYLREAYRIEKFSMTFSRPNPFDANRDFVQPLQKCLAESKGRLGKVEMKGENLEGERLMDLARSAAATGDDASARLKPALNAPRMTRKLKGPTVIVGQEDVAEAEQKRSLLARMREAYQRIRGQAG